jgi:hypothetical protein
MLKAIFSPVRFIILIFAGHKQIRIGERCVAAAVGNPETGTAPEEVLLSRSSILDIPCRYERRVA